jgi:hypothetical protein
MGKMDWINKKEKSEEVPKGEEPLPAAAMTVLFNRLITDQREGAREGGKTITQKARIGGRYRI